MNCLHCLFQATGEKHSLGVGQLSLASAASAPFGGLLWTQRRGGIGAVTQRQPHAHDSGLFITIRQMPVTASDL